MAQLSTDTLIYSQIILKVQEFLLKYNIDKNVDQINFDEDYKKLLSDIEKIIGKPITELDFFHKGEIPSSEKMNKITKNISNDINIIMNQFDSLVSNYINSFNQIMSEIEEEKNFLSRIRSKISVLELYSQSSAKNVKYFGDVFNNLDYIDVSKIRNGYLPDVSDGFACLPRKNVKRTSANVKIVNQSYNNNNQNIQIPYVEISNGFKGSNHLFFFEEENNNPFVFEKDSALIRANELAMFDESPATYFEYETIKVEGNENKPNYEFEYALSSSKTNQSYINWGNADTANSLKLTLELDVRSKNGEYINYLSIVPFFGYSNIDSIKNIKVSSVKFYNEKENTITSLVNETNSFYIGSDIIAPSLSLKNKYFYNKGVLRFEKVKADKIYITFEQEQFNDVTIKHAYWTPYESENLANSPANSVPWRGQERFVPSAVVSDSENYRAEDVSWNKSVVPFIGDANRIKSSTTEVVQAKIKYWQQSQKTFARIRATQNDSSYYFTNDRVNSDNIKVRVFSQNPSVSAKYNVGSSFLPALRYSLIEERDHVKIVLPENQDLNTYISSLKKVVSSFEASSGSATFYLSAGHEIINGDRVYIDASKDSNDITRGIYTVSSSSATSITVSVDPLANIPLSQLQNSFLIKEQLVISEENIFIESFQDSSDSQVTKDLFLKRNFEYIKAKRAAIGIRDIFFGLENYSDVCEIISKPYQIYNNLDLINLQVEEFLPIEKDSLGEIIGSSSIDYYISVDNGLKWIQISPIERPFEGIPEIIAFNQNLSTSERLPQIAYYNYPEVPQKIESIMFRAILKKDRSVTATPIIYSYKFGVKVS